MTDYRGRIMLAVIQKPMRNLMLSSLAPAASIALALAFVTPPARAPAIDVSGVERVVWDALSRGALDLDALASRTALPARELMAAVTRLELSGAVECALTGEVRRR